MNLIALVGVVTTVLEPGRVQRLLLLARSGRPHLHQVSFLKPR